MLIGFGLDVPTSGGTAAINPDMPSCGSISGTKQMLADLGYDPGPIDNSTSIQFQKALASYASSRGLSFQGQLGPNICHPLTQEWQANNTRTGTMSLVFNPAVATRTVKMLGPSPAYTYVGGEVPAEQPATGVKGWWEARSTTEKAIAGVGALLVVGGIAYLLI